MSLAKPGILEAVTEIGVHEAKANLSRPPRRVAAAEEVVITSEGRAAAGLVPIEAPGPCEVGFDAG